MCPFSTLFTYRLHAPFLSYFTCENRVYFILAENEGELRTPMSREELHKRVIAQIKARQEPSKNVTENEK